MSRILDTTLEFIDDDDYKPLPSSGCEYAYNLQHKSQCCPDCGYPLKDILSKHSERKGVVEVPSWVYHVASWYVILNGFVAIYVLVQMSGG